MTHVHKGRFTADAGTLGDEVVVFLIGMRINKPLKVRSWWPVFTAVPTMLAYLPKHPEKGMLGYHQALLPSPIVVQYWRSFEDLARFARDRDDPHLEPWRRFNQRIGQSVQLGYSRDLGTVGTRVQHHRGGSREEARSSSRAHRARGVQRLPRPGR
jgi:hypothetical protein